MGETKPYSVDEDPLVKNLLESVGKEVEVIAFGISYVGRLEKVDIENGYIVISDDEDTAVIEIERMTSMRTLD
jgi:hypothetical protein